MSYVRRRPKPHLCRVPFGSFSPAGNPGDVWRCDDCGTLWKLQEREFFLTWTRRWVRAGPVLRYRHRHEGRTP